MDEYYNEDVLKRDGGMNILMKKGRRKSGFGGREQKRMESLLEMWSECNILMEWVDEVVSGGRKEGGLHMELSLMKGANEEV